MDSEACGCFHCLSIFPPSEIEEWTDELHADQVTAICPHCMIDSVIGSASGCPISREFLETMKKRWFGS